MSKREIDLQRAFMLMQLIKEAAEHGTIYAPIATQARAELEEMLKPEEPTIPVEKGGIVGEQGSEPEQESRR